jgi:hypothetical protein
MALEIIGGSLLYIRSTIAATYIAGPNGRAQPIGPPIALKSNRGSVAHRILGGWHANVEGQGA